MTFATIDSLRGLRAAARLVGVHHLHVCLFLVGLLSGAGKVPVWTLVLAWLLLICCFLLHLVPMPSIDKTLGAVPIDWRKVWRREKVFLVGCAKEAALATLAIYVDSVAVYMVAVINDSKFENITLQDNVSRLLASTWQSHRGLQMLFLMLPELNTDEALFHAFALCILLAVRCEGNFSALANIARLARTIRICRLLRVCCFCSTVMPSQTPNCFLQRYDDTYSMAEHWREALLHWRLGGGCNDLIFSGHGVILALAVLLHAGYGAEQNEELGRVSGQLLPPSSRLPRWHEVFLLARLVHAVLRIVDAHMHMSVDIVVSISLTVLVWQLTPIPAFRRIPSSLGKAYAITRHSLETSTRCCS
eukprot:TRINITY_DN18634_c0_g1_i3.p1 TRINITY_DN18634_c0_g1~~TRINITY_DN18634_c0_g1_i3.p1  ORF type:complete len:361 (-),score=14.61 TRINITY_DN18634_c0_g1_i3:41-1123(-)